MNNKKHSYYFGLIAELFASLYLQIKLYTIISRRFKSPFGEIDIIAKKGNSIIFIEVKARKDTSLMDFISKRQQQRINQTAQYFLLKNTKYQSHNLRFDAIIMNQYLWPKHFKNYW